MLERGPEGAELPREQRVEGVHVRDGRRRRRLQAEPALGARQDVKGAEEEDQEQKRDEERGGAEAEVGGGAQEAHRRSGAGGR